MSFDFEKLEVYKKAMNFALVMRNWAIIIKNVKNYPRCFVGYLLVYEL